MDFIEKSSFKGIRHPWETARADIVWGLAEKYFINRKDIKILDAGCGDCFFLKYARKKLPETAVIEGFDIGSSREFKEKLNSEGLNVYSELDEISGKLYDAVFLMDVLEHIDNDKAFLRKIVAENIKEGGIAVITAPACKKVFSSHDIYLKHKRRYSTGELADISASSGLKVLEKGSMFFLLLAARYVMSKIEKLFGIELNMNREGVGIWKLGRFFALLAGIALKTDFAICRIFAKINVNLPGLSVFLICRK